MSANSGRENPLVSEAIDRVIAAGKASGSTSELGIALFEEARRFGTEDFLPAIAMAMQEGNAMIANPLAGYWAERDLDGAKKWMLGLDVERQANAAAEIAGTWSRAHPREFLDWLDSLPPDARKTIVAVSAAQIVRGAGLADPARVA